MELIEIINNVNIGAWGFLTYIVHQALKGEFKIRFGNGEFFMKYIGPKAHIAKCKK